MTNTRASNSGTKIQNTVKTALIYTKKHTFRLVSYKSDGQQRQDPGRDCRYLQHG